MLNQIIHFHNLGQEYSLAGSTQYAALGEDFTWTCTMFIPSGQSLNAIKFYRGELISVSLIQNDGKCTNQSANPNYIYGCLTDSIYTLTIPAENMTYAEQHSKWRCEYGFDAKYRSSEETLNIKSKINMKILQKLVFLTLSISVSLLLCVCMCAHSFACVCLMYFGIFSI